MMSRQDRRRSSALLSLFWFSYAAQGADATRGEITAEGYFWQKNAWSLTCDNLRTCRVVYGEDALPDEANATHVSVTLMFTQPAGATAMLPLEVKAIGADGEVEDFDIQRQWLDDDSHAAPDDPAMLLAKAAQAHTLFVEVGLPNGSVATAEVALDGLKAVLLKLDDVQRRAGTPLALVAKGNAPSTRVLPPLPKPHKKAMPFPRMTLEKVGIPRDAAARLVAQATQLMGRLKSDDDCPKSDAPDLSVSADHWLLGQACTSGSGYNRTTYWWLGHAKSASSAPTARGGASLQDVEWEALPITGDFDADSGDFVSVHKGRGLGDCESTEGWTYTQEAKWELTERSTNGPCIGIAGGAWYLPTINMEVERVKH